MNKAERKAIIAGNWKMNLTAAESEKLIKEISLLLKNPECEVVICPPAVNIPAVRRARKEAGGKIKIGAQNCHWEKSGAFTGEISRDMLKEYGVEYCVIGHSERRQYFGETDRTVNKRALACLGRGIKPIICVGENLSQREEGLTERFVESQLAAALENINGIMMRDVVIAYEPIWAIGTGKTATSRQARRVCKAIRDKVGSLYGEGTAKALTILYGGSMNASNAESLLSMEDIDGGLIGGASLKARDFAKIVGRTGEK